MRHFADGKPNRRQFRAAYQRFVQAKIFDRLARVPYEELKQIKLLAVQACGLLN
jgi:hypothetical protein